jgi:hypothetical protein
MNKSVLIIMSLLLSINTFCSDGGFWDMPRSVCEAEDARELAASYVIATNEVSRALIESGEILDRKLCTQTLYEHYTTPEGELTGSIHIYSCPKENKDLTIKYERKCLGNKWSIAEVMVTDKK